MLLAVSTSGGRRRAGSWPGPWPVPRLPGALARQVDALAWRWRPPAAGRPGGRRATTGPRSAYIRLGRFDEADASSPRRCACSARLVRRGRRTAILPRRASGRRAAPGGARARPAGPRPVPGGRPPRGVGARAERARLVPRLLGDHDGPRLLRAGARAATGVRRPFGQAETLDSLGYATIGSAGPPAVACYRRALALFREFGDRYNEADSTASLGDPTTPRATPAPPRPPGTAPSPSSTTSATRTPTRSAPSSPRAAPGGRPSRPVPRVRFPRLGAPPSVTKENSQPGGQQMDSVSVSRDDIDALTQALDAGLSGRRAAALPGQRDPGRVRRRRGVGHGERGCHRLAADMFDAAFTPEPGPAAPGPRRRAPAPAQQVHLRVFKITR